MFANARPLTNAVNKSISKILAQRQVWVKWKISPLIFCLCLLCIFIQFNCIFKTNGWHILATSRNDLWNEVANFWLVLFGIFWQYHDVLDFVKPLVLNASGWILSLFKINHFLDVRVGQQLVSLAVEEQQWPGFVFIIPHVRSWPLCSPSVTLVVVLWPGQQFESLFDRCPKWLLV